MERTTVGIQISAGIEVRLYAASRPSGTPQLRMLPWGFPYYFYGQMGDDRFLATNYNKCVSIHYQLHTGQLQPGPA